MQRVCVCLGAVRWRIWQSRCCRNRDRCRLHGSALAGSQELSVTNPCTVSSSLGHGLCCVLGRVQLALWLEQ